MSVDVCKTYTGVGLMSGTSCDGIDLCLVRFSRQAVEDTWQYELLSAVTVPYSSDWKQKLQNFESLSGYDVIKLHTDYGHLLGAELRTFIDKQVKQHHHVDFIASHGHTVFHNPREGTTFQMGDGETMATYLKQPLVTNFRNKDIALGGQGAPIVPFGEKYLFGSYDICMNMGGICNISLGSLGFDVVPCNMILNQLASLHDDRLEYDVDGDIARSGVIIPQLLSELNDLTYYKQSPPKSLAREWFALNIQPLVDQNKKTHSACDLLRTFVEHISIQITNAVIEHADRLPVKPAYDVLITGGGSRNTYLIETLRTHLQQSPLTVVIKDIDKTVCDYKEAIIMAFLGMRTLLGLENIASSGTGATTDSVAGSIHLPPKFEQGKWRVLS